LYDSGKIVEGYSFQDMGNHCNEQVDQCTREISCGVSHGTYGLLLATNIAKVGSRAPCAQHVSHVASETHNQTSKRAKKPFV